MPLMRAIGSNLGRTLPARSRNVNPTRLLLNPRGATVSPTFFQHQQQRRGIGGTTTQPERPLVSSSAGSLNFAYGKGTRTLKRESLPNIWLRDNCRCNKCVNQDTLQRDFDTFQIPADIHPTLVESKEDGVRICWSGADGHESFYPWEFLEFYLQSDRRSPESVEIEYFGAEGPSANSKQPHTIDYSDFSKDEEDAVAHLTASIKRHGLAFISSVPHDSASPTEKLLERIAFIRQTHYGGFYDFVPDGAMADTAYSNVALAAHTDTTYFSDPAGLQAFHLLSHVGGGGGGRGHDEEAAAVVGGEEEEAPESLGGLSLLVDGFHAASLLRAQDPRAFDVLAGVRLPWHASGNRGITIAPDRGYPVLETVDGGGGDPATTMTMMMMHRVRWNNDDRGVVPFGGGGDGGGYTPEDWYGAARKWNEILRRKEVGYWFQLQPGKVVVFDNWRVLHGRSAFTGMRRICGGYINRDDFVSRWRNTNYSRSDILRRIVG